MDQKLINEFNNLASKDDKIRMHALETILQITNEKVDWADEVWDDLLHRMEDDNSFQRSIAIMVLCNLAKSDAQNRMKDDIDRLLQHTRDEKFITSRQCLQNIWKAAVVNPTVEEKVLAHLEEQYKTCTQDKHYNLIRLDIIQAYKNIYDATGDDALRDKILKLIQLEDDVKYRKKYEQVL